MSKRPNILLVLVDELRYPTVYDGPELENTALYRRANCLDKFGFDGWIGPEPHGNNVANCGWPRDPLYARETLELLDRLDGERAWPVCV